VKTAATTTLSLHRSIRLVPDMRPDEYAELRDDIRAHGVKVPLEVTGSTVLDGRHRLRAAKELKLAQVPIREVALDGDSETVWMLKAAVLRRHLSDDQRAMMAALYAKQYPAKRGPKADKRAISSPTGRRNSERPAESDTTRWASVCPSRRRTTSPNMPRGWMWVTD
jgi:ParB-like nuclease domain